MSKVLLISDLHLGSDGCDIDVIKDIAQKYWKGESILFLGDLCDFGIDRGMEFDNKSTPQEQIETLEELTKDLYVKGWVEGNHCLRIFKKTGLNPYKTLFGMEAQNEYNIDGRKIHIGHGKSTAQNTFLEHTKIAQWNNSDLIALGHSHVLAKLTTLNNNKLRHYVRTGCMFNQPAYAVQAGFAPLLMGWAEYNTQTNYVSLKAVYEGKVIDI